MKPSRLAWIAVPVVTVPLLISAAGPARALTATTRYVTTSGSNTDNDCSDPSQPCQSIQFAVDQANAGDTVSVAAGSYPESVTVRLSLTITGAGAGATTVTGDGTDSTFFIDGVDANTVPIVSISNLAAAGNTASDGVEVTEANVTLTDVTASQNAGNGVLYEATGAAAPARGYGARKARIAAEPADAEGQLTLTSSTVSNNVNNGVEIDSGTADISGSVIDANQDGGVIIEGGSASVSDTTLAANVGAGIVADGAGTSTTVTDTTVARTVPFSDSRPQAFGGGILVFPGGLATVSDSTLYANTSFGLGDFDGSVRISNSTVVKTAAGELSDFAPGGLVLDDTVPNRQPSAVGPDVRATVAPSLTAVATITADNAVPDCAGTVTDGGYNLDSDGSCSLHATGDRPDVAQDLHKLADNGGPTRTVRPGVLSPARNVIPVGSAGCVKGATDQRGLPRPDSVIGKCDIGSVEVAIANPTLTATVTAPHHRNGWYRGTVTVTFHCTRGTAVRTHRCPKPTHLHKSGRRHVSRTIRTRDRGHATLHLTITIDNTRPQVTITGVKPGHTYPTQQTIHRTCRDSLSGVASCQLTTDHDGSTVHYEVIARDKAGNLRRKTGEYFIG